jgi:EmrB/QacA subfamily drug resistance transporter
MNDPAKRPIWRGPARAGTGPVPANYRWTVLVNTTVGGFMASLDGSILTVSLPTIARDLHTGVELMLWIMMGYTVVITALLLPLGRLADMRGRVRFYLAGFVVFTLGSLFSGLSVSGTMLLGGRVFQGVGAALMWSNSTAILTDAFPAEERGMALGINQVAVLAGSIGGLVLGGVITSLLGWRWIFFVNVPIGTFGALWTYFSLREVGRLAKNEAVDLPGVVLFVTGLVLVLLALTRVVAGASGGVVATLFAAGLAVLVLFVVIERRQPSPMMDFALLRIRAFTFGNASQFLNAIARGALMFLLTFAFQGVLGASPLRAGVLILPLSLTILIVGPLSGFLSDRYGSRGLTSGGLLISAVALYLLAVIPLTGPYLPVAAALVLAGLGNGMFNSPNTSAVMGSVPPERRGVAASMRSLVFNAGQLFSIALAFAIVSTSMGARELALFLAGATVGVPPAAAAGFEVGLRHALYLSTALSLVAVVLSYARGASIGPASRGGSGAGGAGAARPPA